MTEEHKEKLRQRREDREARRDAYIKAIVQHRPNLIELMSKYLGMWNYEDGIYRFYHQSYKVIGVQEHTLEIVAALQRLAPDEPFCDFFAAIIKRGTNWGWSDAMNKDWVMLTSPIIEAFFHARFFLEMAIKYGDKEGLGDGPFDSGEAALLGLFNFR